MPIVRAQRSIKFAIERLRAQTKDLADQQYPGDHPGPRKWLALVSGLLDTADDFLTVSAEQGTEGSLFLARDAAKFASQAYHSLTVMRGAAIDELPYPIILPLQRWFDQLSILNTTFFRAELVVNYELRGFNEGDFKRIRNPSRSLTQAVGAIKWPVLRVTVPSKAYAILPHFAIVAHEIGHASYYKIDWDLQPFLHLEQENLVSRIAKRLGVRALNKDTRKRLKTSFANWFQELAADAFAFYLTGPAIFFSLSDFFQLLGGTYGLSHTHPASDLRRKTLFDKLKTNDCDSFAAIFARHTGHVLTEDFNSPLLVPAPQKDEIFSDMEKRYEDREMAAVLAELHESMPSVIPIIYEHVEKYMKAHAPGALYTSEKYAKDLQDHLKPMLAAIPPIETGPRLIGKAPAEFASILNVGWATLLTKLSELRVRTKDDHFGEEKLKCLHELLLKAVELSEARRLWESVL